MEDAPLTVRCSGNAGQSFGVWNAGGLNLYLEGDANDYVGKGMAGGRIVLRHPSGARFPHEAARMSNPGIPLAAMVRSGPADTQFTRIPWGPR